GRCHRCASSDVAPPPRHAMPAAVDGQVDAVDRSIREQEARGVKDVSRRRQPPGRPLRALSRAHGGRLRAPGGTVADPPWLARIAFVAFDGGQYQMITLASTAERADDSGGFGKIEADTAGSTAELTGNGRRALCVATRDDDLGALLREMTGDLLSEPRGPTHDDDAARVGHQTFGGSRRDFR